MADDTSNHAESNDRDDQDDRGRKAADKPTRPEKEIGGRDGPDPTRYGDWEKAGRCIDF